MSLQGGGSFGRSRDIPIPLGDGETGNLNLSGWNVGGRAGVNVDEKIFGLPVRAGLTGYYGQNTNRLSPNLQALGAPADKTYTSKGITNLDVGIGSPDVGIGRVTANVRDPFDSKRRYFGLGFRRNF